MITQKQYVARLEKMLRLDEPCNHCPLEDVIGRFAYCDMCRDFIGVGFYTCPCSSFSRPHTALKRAGRAIREYRAGMHKWCKEGK